MKVVILCGGIGSRLAEETRIIPKPMIKIVKKPIIDYIIGIYKHFGFKVYEEVEKVNRYFKNLLHKMIESKS